MLLDSKRRLAPLGLALGLALPQATPALAGPRAVFKATRELVDAQYSKGNGEQPTKLWAGSALQYAHVGAQAAGVFVLAKSLHLDTAWQYLSAAGVAWTGWQLADVAAGTLHNLFDGYGSANTPILGSLLRIFKDHHRDALAQTRASLPYLIAPFTFLSVPLMLHASGADVSATMQALTLGFGVGLPLAGVSHKYSHLRDNVGRFVKGMRAAGLYMKPTEHDRHHRFPNSKAFGQLSGLTNKPAEKLRYHERLQALIYRATGAVHDSWRNPRGGHEAMVAALGSDPSKHPQLPPPR